VGSAATVDRHPWLTPDEARTLCHVLIDVWEDAEANDDETTVAKAKAALDHLQLPWVRP